MQSKMEKTVYPEQGGTERIIPISTKRNPGKNVPFDPKIVDLEPSPFKDPPLWIEIFLHFLAQY